MDQLAKKHAKKLRFALVGGINTAIDFGILFGLVALGIDKIFANVISTSTAFMFSFFANRSFTFKSASATTKKQLATFVVITIFGLWVIQPFIILTVGYIATAINLPSSLSLLIGKLIATVATMIWNYVLYSKFVFKKEA